MSKRRAPKGAGMTKRGGTLADWVRGTDPSDPLPEKLGSLNSRQLGRALAERTERIPRLAEEGRRSPARRDAIKEEIRAATADVKRLRAVGADVAGSGDASAAQAILDHNVGPARRARKRMPAQEAIAAVVHNWAVPGGLRLDPEKLSDVDGHELYGLLERRFLPSFPGLDERGQRRFEALIEQAAGQPVFQHIREDADFAAFAEQVRRDSLPKRVTYAEVGSVTLPAGVFDWLRHSKDGRWTVADVGALAVLLHCFELRDASVIERGTFEGDVLVVKGRLRFAATVNSPLASEFGGSHVEIDLERLVLNGWLVSTRGAAGRLELRLGPKAKALQTPVTLQTTERGEST